MTSHLASCSCGKLTVGAQGDPVRISICHCLACQRRPGSVFGAQARFPADKVSVEGQSKEYMLVGGTRAAWPGFTSARNAGTTVFYLLDATPGLVAVPVGTFADPDFPQPHVSVYEVRNTAGWLFLMISSTTTKQSVDRLIALDNSLSPESLCGSDHSSRAPASRPTVPRR